MALTTRADLLNSIVPPPANQDLAKSMQESQTMQMQDQLSKLSPQATQAQGQSAANATTANQGQIALTAQKQGQQIAGAQGQNVLTTLQQQTTAQNVKSQIALSQTTQQLSNQLSQLSVNANNLLVKDQLAFEKDQSGNVVWKERQLADWTVLNAKTQNQFNEMQLAASSASRRKIQILQAAHDQINQAINTGYIADKQIKDKTLEQQLVLDKQAIDLQIQAEQNRARNRLAMFTSIGGVVGAIGGGVAGGILAAPTVAGAPVGAAAGAMAGEKLGEGVGSILSSALPSNI